MGWEGTVGVGFALYGMFLHPQSTAEDMCSTRGAKVAEWARLQEERFLGTDASVLRTDGQGAGFHCLLSASAYPN